MARSYPLPEPDRMDIDPELAAAPPLIRVKMPYGKETWLITSHREARAVLSDPRFVRTTGTGSTSRAWAALPVVWS